MNEVWACIAGGSSLTREQVAFCRMQGWRLATCNMGFRIAPDADLFHAMDSQWWNEYGKEALQTLSRHAAIYTGCPRAALNPGLIQITWDGKQGYSPTPNHCHGGKLSGIQLIQIVGWRKPYAMILLGYDNHGPHWHQDYPPHMTSLGVIDQQLGDYAKLASELPFPVYNCSPGSAIDDFPKWDLEDARDHIESRADFPPP